MLLQSLPGIREPNREPKKDGTDINEAGGGLLMTSELCTLNSTRG